MKTTSTATYKMIVGERLKQLQGETAQGELAKRLGVTQSYLSQVEQGNKLPSLGMLCHFAITLGVPVAFLLGEADSYEETPLAVHNVLPVDSSRRELETSDMVMDVIANGEPASAVMFLLSIVKDKIIRYKDNFTEQDAAFAASYMDSCKERLKTREPA